MDKSALELIPAELQGVTLSDADLARAVSMAQPANRTVREAADQHLAFEDEPAGYLAFARKFAERQR